MHRIVIIKEHKTPVPSNRFDIKEF